MSKLNFLAVCLKAGRVEELERVRGAEMVAVGIAKSYAEASVLLDRLLLQAIIVECEELGAEAQSFLTMARGLASRPVIAVIAVTPLVRAGAESYGAHLVLNEDADAHKISEVVVSEVENVKNKYVEFALGKDRMLDERLANIFISAGIPPHIKGFQFLREAVKQAVGRPEMINNITKQLYPAVACKYSTTSSKVERAIRHAIEVAWTRGKIENINNIYGIKVLGKGDKPTNGELIALISDKMLIECG